MRTRFVCLANSFKEGGRCLAGVVLNSNNQPLFEGGHPCWIRPVSRSLHGEWPNSLAAPIGLLQVVELEVEGQPPAPCYQAENRYFNPASVRVVGHFAADGLDALCSTRNQVFGGSGKAVGKNMIEMLGYSLMLVRTKRFCTAEKCYDDHPAKQQLRLHFTYRGLDYDLPITDPHFLQSYHSRPTLLDDCAELYLVLSLGLCWKDWYYKLVGTIIRREAAQPQWPAVPATQNKAVS